MIGLVGFFAIWGTARWFGWSRALFWVVMALWWALLVLVHAPWFGSPTLARLVGGEFRGWILLAPLALLETARSATANWPVTPATSCCERSAARASGG